MLHPLPDLLDSLESQLVHGQDPLPLLSSIRWSDVVDWPQDLGQALALNGRLRRIQVLLEGLNAPLRAALVQLEDAPVYGPGFRRR